MPWFRHLSRSEVRTAAVLQRALSTGWLSCLRPPSRRRPRRRPRRRLGQNPKPIWVCAPGSDMFFSSFPGPRPIPAPQSILSPLDWLIGWLVAQMFGWAIWTKIIRVVWDGRVGSNCSFFCGELDLNFCLILLGGRWHDPRPF